MIDELNAVAVAVEGDAEIGTARNDGPLQCLRVCRAAFGIDVESVRLRADRNDVGAEIREEARRDLVGRAMRAIEHDVQPAQVERLDARDQERPVAVCAVGDARGLADLVRRDGPHRLRESMFDRELELVGQLLARGIEELHAVVEIGVVRSRDDEARARPKLAREPGDGRRRHRAEQLRTGAGRDQTGLERGFEHVAGDARVLADQHVGPAIARCAQHAPERMADAQHEFGRDRLLADPAANAVGSEILLVAHGWALRPGLAGTDVTSCRSDVRIAGCLQARLRSSCARCRSRATR